MSKRKDQEISIEYKYHVIKRFEIKEATHVQIAQDLDVNHSLIMRSLNKSMTIQTMTKSKNLEQTITRSWANKQANKKTSYDCSWLTLLCEEYDARRERNQINILQNKLKESVKINHRKITEFFRSFYSLYVFY